MKQKVIPLNNSTHEIPLLQTKLQMPRTLSGLVARPRIHACLDEELRSKLTLVVAPAGYGKTTAVLDWLGRCGLPAAWLSVDAYDNNPVQFWQYVCSALDIIAVGVRRDTEYVFASRELLQANIHINILIDRLAEVQSDFLLVLDDLHAVTDLPSC